MASFWVQHGYGKSDKIKRLYDAGLLGGVLLSPADEDHTALQGTRESTPDVEVLLDPQTYVYSIPGGTARCHDAHGLDIPNLNWGMPASEVEAVVQAVINANDRLGVADLIAPTCVQRSLNDVWTSLALQMARTTISIVGGSAGSSCRQSSRSRHSQIGRMWPTGSTLRRASTPMAST